eukprot:CAMPEP_0118720500 /NCGR_PEP_ID=MMETSP0800-20121206/30142_1 /TAXON_ID=210618 ORGANISM="Striatella unipunctata, Strain CCMP2910" /NCGR_SAMPLE_ID=MMETSP0800 /ASSEMBLY_ACC=CAM_ASM_000638 /LENGTH=249 /DNA_ID=CAMNT_0006628141 /DNA_START=35 /DNA_END=781 /DNA_ORIENTATION=+
MNSNLIVSNPNQGEFRQHSETDFRDERDMDDLQEAPYQDDDICRPLVVGVGICGCILVALVVTLVVVLGGGGGGEEPIDPGSNATVAPSSTRSPSATSAPTLAPTAASQGTPTVRPSTFSPARTFPPTNQPTLGPTNVPTSNLFAILGSVLDEAEIDAMSTYAFVTAYSDATYVWKNKSRWVSGSHVCEWFGVRCTADLVVTEIVLPGNQLSGKLPREMRLLSKLGMQHNVFCLFGSLLRSEQKGMYSN